MRAAAKPGLAPLEWIRREAAQEIVARTVAACERRYGSRVRAVILTGSLARDEATFLTSGGQCRVLGDAEFLLVFNRGAKLPAAAAVDSLGERIMESLARRGIACPVHLAAVQPRYLARLPAHIFSHELGHAGRVVHGDEGVLRLVPAFSPAHIDREDAWRLLSNRLIEWLEARATAEPRADDPPIELSYATAKLWMDAATSLLVFLGEYEAGYAARAARLATLDGDLETGVPFPIARFRAAVDQATSWKLRPETFAADSFGWSFCEEARRFAVRLWRWELGRMTGQSANLPPLALCGAFARRASRKRRMRGWLRVARQTGPVTAWHHRRRWVRLGREGSPRHWLYAVAAECAIRGEEPAALSGESRPQGPWAETLHGFLPIPGLSNEAAGEWQSLVLDLAWNYHEFVERTRA
jgi:hypothetical protein